MPKNVIIVVDDCSKVGDLYKEIVAHNFPDSGYQVVYCSNREECFEALQKHAASVRCLITDNQFHGCKYEGANIVVALRDGVYGEEVKTIPAAIASFDSPVLWVDPPISILNKFDTGEIRRYIEMPSITISKDDRKDRNNNAKMLIEFLRPDHAQRYCLEVGFPGHPAYESAAERMHEMRKRLRFAFAGGAPDREILESLKAALDSGDGVYIQDDSQKQQYNVLRDRIRERVNAALGVNRG